MPDIRKMLERQLEILQHHSEMRSEGNAPSENTFAMLEIVDVLYPEGIPEASATSKLTANVTLDTDSFVSQLADMFGKSSMTIEPTEITVSNESDKFKVFPKVEDLYLPSARVEVDTEKVASMVIDHLKKNSRLIARAGDIEIRIDN